MKFTCASLTCGWAGEWLPGRGGRRCGVPGAVGEGCPVLLAGVGGAGECCGGGCDGACAGNICGGPETYKIVIFPLISHFATAPTRSSMYIRYFMKPCLLKGLFKTHWKSLEIFSPIPCCICCDVSCAGGGAGCCCCGCDCGGEFNDKLLSCVNSLTFMAGFCKCLAAIR